MAYGNYNGKDLSDPELRKEFDRDYVLQTDWYKGRLKLKQKRDVAFLKNQIQYLENFKENPINWRLVEKMDINHRIEKAKMRLSYVESEKYINDITGTIGADALFKKG